MERQRDREMRGFSFVFEIYILYFSIFQDNYSALLMNLSAINFDFSIFKNELINLSPKILFIFFFFSF